LAEKPESKLIVLQNATIHSMSSQGILVGSILIQDGKIQSVGDIGDPPADAIVVDLKGYTVVPGLIDARSTLWLSENAAKEKNDKGELNVADAIDLWNEDWHEVAAQGVTAVYVQPGNASSLGGYGAVLCVGPQASVDEIILKREAAAQAAIGITGSTSRDRFAQFEKLRTGIKQVKDELEKERKAEEERKKKAEEEARKNQAEQAERTETRRPGTRGGRPGSGRGGPGRRPTPQEGTPPKADDTKDGDQKEADQKKAPKKPDPTKELWKKILAREIPLHVEAHHSDAIKQVLALAKEFDMRVVLDGVSQAASCSTDIVESNRPAVVGPLWQTGSPPAYRKDANYEWLNHLADNGNLWSIATFSNHPRGSRMLRFQAAQALAMGVSKEDVLRAITINAARMLGVAKQIGSIEAGKNADIAVFAGDPLDPSTSTRMVICGGKIIFEVDAKPTASAELSLPELPKNLPTEYAIRTNRLLQNGQFGPATLVVSKGKVAQITNREDVEIKDVTTFDVKDAPVTPGLVVAHSHLKQNRDLADEAESDVAHLLAVDCADPSSDAAKKMLAGGFTDVAFAPLSTNTSAGIVGHIRLSHSDFVQRADIANKFVLAKSARNDSRFPASLTGQMQLLGGLFEGQVDQTQLYVSSAVRRSLEQVKKSGVAKVKSGQRKALFEADSSLELRYAFSVINSNALDAAILTKGNKIHEYADELVASGAGVILQPFNGEEYDTVVNRIAKTCSPNVPLAFAGESPEQVRMTAAMLVSAGMPRDQVLRGLTGDGAALAGMNNAGQLSGADDQASFIIWSDSPLNPAARPLHIVVGGKSVQQKK
jgi:imidazolonepropionase-like amidohydrolase